MKDRRIERQQQKGSSHGEARTKISLPSLFCFVDVAPGAVDGADTAHATLHSGVYISPTSEVRISVGPKCQPQKLVYQCVGR
jgi:hypothetical protein